MFENMRDSINLEMEKIFQPIEKVEGIGDLTPLKSECFESFFKSETFDPESFRKDALLKVHELKKRARRVPIESRELVEKAAEELHDLFFGKMYRHILEKEYEWIDKKRELLSDTERGDPSKDAFGLALSGGGIRSATFNLGLLQAMQRYGVLPAVDYLSTVSGGGYIGSSLTWLRYVKPEIESPYGTKRKDHAGTGGKVLAWLRDHGNYLTPGNGLSTWSLIGAFLGSVLVNLAILLPIFMFLTAIVYLSAPANIFLWAGIGSILIYLLYIAKIVLQRGWIQKVSYFAQRKDRERAGKILMIGTLLLAIGSIPPLHDYIHTHLSGWIGEVSLSSVAAGLASFLGAYRHTKTKKSAPSGTVSLLLSTGVALMLYGVIVWIYHLIYISEPGSEAVMPALISFTAAALILLLGATAKKSPKIALAFAVVVFAVSIFACCIGVSNTSPLTGFEKFFLASVPLSALFAGFTKINYVSMHRYYRNRLMEAFFPWSVVDVPVAKADSFLLKDMKPAKTPYHIINTNVNMVGSGRTKERERGGDNFILSPCFCGSDVTGYRSTDRFASGGMNLATAFSISGAAVDPNTYATRSKPISFVMSLLNARLGYWIENPREIEGAERIGWSYYYYIFKELFGKGLNENEKYIHLADGGHFENLGLYELIRRKCRYIIVSDAGKDPAFTFGDLAHIIELARVDFGAEIEIDTRPLRPYGENRISETAFVQGQIKYEDGTVGDMIYIKTTVIKDLPEDIYSYRRTNPSFPDQTTADQFFDESQFEAYRELGYQIGKRLCKASAEKGFRTIFDLSLTKPTKC